MILVTDENGNLNEKYKHQPFVLLYDSFIQVYGFF